MATQPIVSQKATSDAAKPAKALLLENATNEVVFAVVGYVGSGTSEIAAKLKGLLENTALPGGKFDVEILKARKVIEDWATRNGENPPTTPQNDLPVGSQCGKNARGVDANERDAASAA
jgi:hypothetical protein